MSRESGMRERLSARSDRPGFARKMGIGALKFVLAAEAGLLVLPVDTHVWDVRQNVAYAGEAANAVVDGAKAVYKLTEPLRN